MTEVNAGPNGSILDERECLPASIVDLEERQPVETEPTGAAARERQIELAVFLFLIVPSLVLSFVHGGPTRLPFVLLAVAVMSRDLALVALVVFFLWRNGESLRRIGWKRGGWSREVGLGLLLFFPLQAGAAVLEQALRRIGLSVPAHLPPGLEASGLPQALVGLVLVTVVAIAEETIFRGYVLLRLKSFGSRAAVAVLLSSVVFAIGHGYEGTAGVVTVGTMGAVFALVYLWRGSLVAPVTMHFLVDFGSLVLFPLLAHRAA